MLTARGALLHTTALMGALALGLAVAPQAAAQAKDYIFDIPATSLSDALREFGRTTRQQVVFTEALTGGKQTGSIRGQLSGDAALARLLAGSGLEAQRTGSGAIVIQRATGTQRPQGDAADQPATAVSEVLVTGTRIRGANPTSPVISIDKAAIAARAVGTTGELIRQLPQSYGGGLQSNTVGARGFRNLNNWSNQDSANLRGLGSDATLVLLDGQRLVASGAGFAADISVIPLPLIDRVDVLTDGASAIYGSDAVGGVVNFILRKRFDGVETRAEIADTTRGGGRTERYSLTSGKTWEGGGAVASLNYSTGNGLDSSKREFAAATADPTRLTNSFEDLSFYVRADQTLTDNLKVFATGLFLRRDNGSIASSSPTSTVTGSTLDKQRQITAGGDLDIGGGWTISATTTLGRDEAFRQARDRTGAFTLTPRRFRYLQASADLQATGPLFALPAGDVQVAVGAGHRREKSANIVQISHREIDYAFGEFRVPLLSGRPEHGGAGELTASLAGRYESYSDAGNEFLPKIGLSFQAAPSLALRASWGKSFRAPPLSIGNDITQSFIVGVADPQSPTGTSTALILVGGNPNITSESAKTWTTGLEFSPRSIEGLSISLNYFDIDFTKRIAQVNSPLAVLTDPANNPYVTRNPSKQLLDEYLALSAIFSNFTSGPYDPARIAAAADFRYSNLASQKASGWDFSAKYRFPLASGSLATSISASKLRIDEKFTPASPVSEITGLVFYPPPWRANAQAIWTSGPLSLSAAVFHVPSIIDQNQIARPTVKSWTSVDAVASYAFDERSDLLARTRITLSINNLFDKDPPRLAATSSSPAGLGYDGTNASPLGRVLRVAISKIW